MSETPTGIIQETRQRVKEIAGNLKEGLPQVKELIIQRRGREALQLIAGWFNKPEEPTPPPVKEIATGGLDTDLVTDRKDYFYQLGHLDVSESGENAALKYGKIAEKNRICLKIIVPGISREEFDQPSFVDKALVGQSIEERPAKFNQSVKDLLSTTLELTSKLRTFNHECKKLGIQEIGIANTDQFFNALGLDNYATIVRSDSQRQSMWSSILDCFSSGNNYLDKLVSHSSRADNATSLARSAILDTDNAASFWMNSGTILANRVYKELNIDAVLVAKMTSEVAKVMNHAEQKIQLQTAFLQGVENNNKLLVETGSFPLLTHFSAVENFIQMLDGVKKYGADSLKLRSSTLNNLLGINYEIGGGHDLFGGPAALSNGEAGAVSFFVVGQDRRLSSHSDVIGGGRNILIVMPYTNLFAEDIKRTDSEASYPVPRELQPIFSSEGTEENWIKKGFDLSRQDVIIYVPKVNQAEVEAKLVGLQDQHLAAKLRKNIHYEDDEGFVKLNKQIREWQYYPILVKNIAETSDGELNEEQVMDFFATYKYFVDDVRCLDEKPNWLSKFSGLNNIKIRKPALFYKAYNKFVRQGNYYPSPTEMFEEMSRLCEPEIVI